MPPESFHILIAVHDRIVRDSLADYLTVAGFRIKEASTVQITLELVRQERFDAVVLGIDLSGEADIEICRTLRTLHPDVGVVVVRASGGSEGQVLDAGADDCIALPLRFREVVGRLSVVLRQVRADLSPRSKTIRARDLEIDIERRRFWRGKVEIRLSSREFDLLALLMNNPEVTLTHAQLLRTIWGPGTTHSASHLRAYVKTLRCKIENDPNAPEHILTEPWVGYRFHVPHTPR